MSALGREVVNCRVCPIICPPSFQVLTSVDSEVSAEVTVTMSRARKQECPVQTPYSSPKSPSLLISCILLPKTWVILSCVERGWSKDKIFKFLEHLSVPGTELDAPCGTPHLGIKPKGYYDYFHFTDEQIEVSRH